METKPSINDVTFKNNTETLAVVSTAELVGNGGKKRADRAGGHAGHSWLNLALIVLTWVVFISTLVVNGLAASGGLGASNNSTTGNVARKYYIEITPQSWTFGFCWAIIYSWLVLQLFYIVSTIFRRGLYGDFLYVTPPLITPVFYVALCVNLICNTLWLVLWARELILVCLFIIIGAAVTVYIPIVSCAYRTVKYEEEMIDGGCKKDIWLVRVLIQNGLGFYAAWLSIAWLLNLAIAIAYKNNIDQSIASTTSLILLGVELATYFILDVFVINKYTHYIVSPYITAMLALAGSMDKNWDATKSNSINTAALFGIACIGLIVKLVTIFVAPEVKKRIGKNQVWNVKA